MDDGRSLRPVENHELQEPRRSVGTENELPGGIVTDLLDDDGVSQGVQDVLRLDIVARRGSEDLHKKSVLRNCRSTLLVPADNLGRTHRAAEQRGGVIHRVRQHQPVLFIPGPTLAIVAEQRSGQTVRQQVSDLLDSWDPIGVYVDCPPGECCWRPGEYERLVSPVLVKLRSGDDAESLATYLSWYATVNMSLDHVAGAEEAARRMFEWWQTLTR